MKDERIEGSEPAFAQDENGNDRTGFSRREYAAIHLRVPNSGTQWLDDMITQRMRDDFAGQALNAYVGKVPVTVVRDLLGSFPDAQTITNEQGRIQRLAIARVCWDYADALLAARETDGGVG